MEALRFWRHQKERYRLIGTKCDLCGRPSFPPEGICPGDHAPFFKLVASMMIALKFKKVNLEKSKIG